MKPCDEQPSGIKWSENQIAAALARQMFDRRYLVVVPNCSWPGSECDLLVVTDNLRVIDVEIKISRADLKADARKDKWFHHWDFRIDGPRGDGDRRRREWPQKVWKHYYAVPAEIWSDDLFDALPSERSGVLLLKELNEDRWGGHCSKPEVRVTVQRPAKPCRDADRIHPEDAVDIARLASLRMWEALTKLEAKRVAA